MGSEHPYDPDELGDPALQVAGLKVWIHGRSLPESDDYWDGNWMVSTTLYESGHSRILANGPEIHLSEIVSLQRSCERLYKTPEGVAGLHCMEPNLDVALTAEAGGRISVKISITPDHLNESHEYHDGIDQSYLPAIIDSCRHILERFPVKKPEQLPSVEEQQKIIKGDRKKKSKRPIWVTIIAIYCLLIANFKIYSFVESIPSDIQVDYKVFTLPATVVGIIDGLLGVCIAVAGFALWKMKSFGRFMYASFVVVSSTLMILARVAHLSKDVGGIGQLIGVGIAVVFLGWSAVYLYSDEIDDLFQ